MKGWQIENFQVARFYGVSPEVVDGWLNVDFLDRQEFMFLQLEIDGAFDGE